MKKLFTIAMILTAATLVFSSCNKKKSDTFYMSLVTLVEGSWSTGNFYVKFDSGETAYVTNAASYTFKPTLDNESRAIIYYAFEDQTATGFDKVITLSAAYGIPTDPVRDIYDHTFGEQSKYPDRINIEEAYFAQNYLTMQISFRWGGNSTTSNHSVALVYNSKENHEGDFQTMYLDDDYLYLELYHNANNDTESYEYGSYVCYKVKPELLNISLDDYVGIKILYKPVGGSDPAVYSVNFKK